MPKTKRTKKSERIKKFKSDISYHNKDILFKFLSENYKKKSLSVYGLDLPPIKEVLPTNLPFFSINEKRSDNIFLLENDIVLIVEYESSIDIENLIKYGHYLFRVYEKYYKEKQYKVILAVIYTGEIENAPDHLDIGSVQLKFLQVFLSKFNSDVIYDELKRKLENNISLTDEEVMKFIILPLTGKNNKQVLIEKSINLAKEVKDENTQDFIIAGILSASDKFIDQDYSYKIREWLSMTKVERVFQEEKEEELKKLAMEKDKEKDEALKEKVKQIAKNFLLIGSDIIDVMRATGLSKSEVEELQKVNNILI